MSDRESLIEGVPLHHVDRDLRRAVERLGRARAALARGEADAAWSPLDTHRGVSSRSSFETLAPPAPIERPGEALGLAAHEAPAPIVIDDPLRVALRDWIAALTLERVLWADRVRVAAALRSTSVPIDQTDLGRILLSPHELRRRILAEPDRGLRAVYASALTRGAGTVADAARILAERRAEAARRLPIDLDALTIPCEARSALPALARDLLRRSEPMLRPAGEGWHDSLAESLGRDAAEGWPSRLSSRWIEQLFHPTRLTEGLRLSLGDLPAALGASSFARALAAFGASYADEAAPRDLPFALAHAPFDLRRARRAALFGALVADPTWQRHALGLGRDRARAQARKVARALLRGLRLDAARVLLHGALLEPSRNRSQLFEERSAEALLGTPIPPALAGVVPALGPDDGLRFLGVLLAAGDRRRLVEAFDEDWFKSPHAAAALRDEDSSVGFGRRATAAEAEAGLAELCQVLGALG
jgi:hypothetical protein